MPEVRVRGTKIHYWEVKGKSSNQRRKVILVHGSGGNASPWRKVMDQLSPEYDVLAVDLPGHGLSEGDGLKSVAQYREFLKEFFDILEFSSLILGGNSMGGGIVQDFALHYPEKLRAILLMGTGARLRVVPEALENFRKMAEGIIPSKFEPWAFGKNAPAEVIAEGEREWAKTNSKVRYQDFLTCDQFDLMGKVEEIALPTLIVCGREDLLTPVKYSEFLRKKIPGSKMEIIEGAGHMLMLEAPQKLGAVLTHFLGSL